jgi:hypothetical protein
MRRQILLLILIAVVAWSGGQFLGTTKGFDSGYNFANVEQVEYIENARYKVLFANFKQCAFSVHANNMSFLSGAEGIAWARESLLRAKFCQDILDRAAEVVPEDQDWPLGMLLLWWDGYLRQMNDTMELELGARAGQVPQEAVRRAARELEKFADRLELEMVRME